MTEIQILNNDIIAVDTKKNILRYIDGVVYYAWLNSDGSIIEQIPINQFETLSIC